MTEHEAEYYYARLNELEEEEEDAEYDRRKECIK